MQNPDRREPERRIRSAVVYNGSGTGCSVSTSNSLSVEWAIALVLGAVAHYSPFKKAADGKIPLSMVQVKLKPQ
jgi:hypothetical protein